MSSQARSRSDPHAAAASQASGLEPVHHARDLQSERLSPQESNRRTSRWLMQEHISSARVRPIVSSGRHEHNRPYPPPGHRHQRAVTDKDRHPALETELP